MTMPVPAVVDPAPPLKGTHTACMQRPLNGLCAAQTSTCPDGQASDKADVKSKIMDKILFTVLS
jgi:hypothetical protein